VLQRGVVCCSVLSCGSVCRSVLQCVAICCSVLQCVEDGAVCRRAHLLDEAMLHIDVDGGQITALKPSEFDSRIVYIIPKARRTRAY